MNGGRVVESGERAVHLHCHRRTTTRESCLRRVSCARSRHDRSPLQPIRSSRRGTCRSISLSSGGRKLVAIDDLDLDLFPGKTLALVGESGSGKSTVARCLMRLIEPTDGGVFVHGKSIMLLSSYQMSHMYRHVQMVFQDPNASLNPRMTVRQVLEEPLKLHLRLSRKGTRGSCSRACRHGRPDHRASRPLPARTLRRTAPAHRHRPRARRAARGGVARRADGLARRLGSRADPRSAARPQKEFNLAYLFISHDLQVVRHVSDEVAVMYLGVHRRDAGRPRRCSVIPGTPIRRRCCPPLPSRNGESSATRTRLTGEINSPIDPPDACRLVGRCPVEQPSCARKQPQLYDLGDGHSIACPIVALPPRTCSHRFPRPWRRIRPNKSPPTLNSLSESHSGSVR